MDLFGMLKELVVPLIILQLITFAVLVYFLRKIMYSSSAEELLRLKKLEEEHRMRTEELASKLDEADKQFKSKMDIAEDEARRMKAQTKAEAEKLKDEMIDKARQESERIVNQALNSKSKIKEDLESQIREKCVKLSEDMLRKVLGSEHQRSLHDGLVDEMIAELEKIDAGKLAIQEEEGEIVSPYELSKDRVLKVESLLSRKTGKKISLSVKIEKQVIAGMIIKIGSLAIDGSLSGRLKDDYED
jgi:F-type H+-transporting ATPase subunit b